MKSELAADVLGVAEVKREVVDDLATEAAGVCSAAGLGVFALNSEVVDGLATEGAGVCSAAGLGANNEVAADGFGVAALNKEVEKEVCAGLTVAGASGDFSVAGVGVAGTSELVFTLAKRFLAGAVAGGAAAEKPAKGFDALGAGVALMAWSLDLSGKDMRLNILPPDASGALGVASASVDCCA